jgi:hypothetical protein
MEICSKQPSCSPYNIFYDVFPGRVGIFAAGASSLPAFLRAQIGVDLMVSTSNHKGTEVTAVVRLGE